MIAPHYTVEETRLELLRIAEELLSWIWQNHDEFNCPGKMRPTFNVQVNRANKWLDDFERYKIREINDSANAVALKLAHSGEERQHKNIGG